MRPRISKLSVALGAILAAGLGFSAAGSQAQPIAPAPADAVAPAIEGAEVMTRGVVHEAFAEVVTEPKPGLIVSKRPADPIEEVPPEFKPDDEAAIWITGYWAWDDERDDFFWVSGVWRVPPPGMRWVAGYWNEVPGGWQWTSGFWVPVETREMRYYDAPPASLEVGPSSPSPGDDHFWVPGSWNYYDTGYRWGPGYWAPYREDWVWISPRYFWTPAGCVYRPGYWDYRLTRRGCLFAPVYFTQPIYAQPNFVYRPWCALNTSNLFVHLWVRPNYSHFYFGNYYGSNFGSYGFTPWCHYRPYRGCYDPMLTQLQCHYRRQGVNYVNRLDGWHRHYSGNAGARPPRTWNEQVKIVNNTTIVNNKTNIKNVNVQQNILAVNVNDSARHKDLPVKLARLEAGAQKQALNVAHEARDLRKQRIAVERPAGINPTRERGKGDLTLTNPTARQGNDPNPTRERGNPKRENVKLDLPATQVERVAKERVKLAPPKLSQAKPESPKDASNPRFTPPGSSARTEPGKALPQPKLENPVSPAREISPRPEPRLKTPRPEPKIETPRLQPKNEAPPQSKLGMPRPTTEKPRSVKPEPFMPRPELPRNNPQPKRETPEPQHRILSPQPKIDRPQPKLETPQPRIERPQPRIETPQPRIERSQPRIETPQPRIETPRPQARIEAPRSQSRIETPRPSPRVNFSPPAPRMQSAPQRQPVAPAVHQQPAPRRESAPRPNNGSGGNGRGNRKK